MTETAGGNSPEALLFTAQPEETGHKSSKSTPFGNGQLAISTFTAQECAKKESRIFSSGRYLARYTEFIF